MRYCYKKPHKKLYATGHIRQHLLAEMKHHDFITTAELKFKKSTGSGQYTLFSIETVNRPTLFRWWINVRRRQVGVVYTGPENRESSVVFDNVGLAVKTWIQLTLNFQGSENGRPLVEMYVNCKKIATKYFDRPIREAFKNVLEDQLKVFLADRGFSSFYKLRGKVKSYAQIYHKVQFKMCFIQKKQPFSTKVIVFCFDCIGVAYHGQES